jgi:hypothetical protein
MPSYEEVIRDGQPLSDLQTHLLRDQGWAVFLYENEAGEILRVAVQPETHQVVPL